MSSYTYSVSEDFPNGVAVPGILGIEIRDSSIVTTYSFTLVNDDSCVINFEDDLSAEDQTTLDGIVASHTGDKIITPTNITNPENFQKWLDPVTGMEYYYDSNRSIWLSVDHKCWVFSRMKNSDGIYLSLGDSPDGFFGYYVPYPALVTGIMCRADIKRGSKTFELHDGNNNAEVLYSFTITDSFFMNHALAVNLDAGALLQLWVSDDGHKAKRVTCQVEIAWRYSE